MEFKYKVSKSLTIHVNDKTLSMLEKTREAIGTYKGEIPCYDTVIQLALKTGPVKASYPDHPS